MSHSQSMEPPNGQANRGLIEAAAHRAAEIAAVMPTITPSVGPAFTQPPPDSFIGYEIIRELHRGGQGVVFQAIQKATKRKVAIKVMREGPLADARDKARFEREVQILGQLKHPNIVSIHDSGTAAGCSFYVMDYISGQALDVYMANAQRTMEETLGIFAKICDAINAAHLRGVIHRDLKPSNIIVESNDEPHVLDFGLAKIASGGVTDESMPQVMTVTGQFLGSLPFASPEQAAGSPDKIDVRSDVYSLGVILYQMLTGCFPYVVVGNMREVLSNILNSQPIRPSTLRRQIKDEVETIVLKCLSKERERRYQSAGELGRDVIRYLGGEPIEAKRDSLWYVVRKTAARRKVPVAATALILLVLGSGYAAWSRNHALAESNRQQHVAAMIKTPWDYSVGEPEVEDMYDDFFARLKKVGQTTVGERDLFFYNMNHVNLVARQICALDHDWYIAVMMTNRAYFDDHNFWMGIHTVFYLGDQQIGESFGAHQVGGKGASHASPADLIKLAQLKPPLKTPVQLVLKSVTTILVFDTPFPGMIGPSTEVIRKWDTRGGVKILAQAGEDGGGAGGARANPIWAGIYVNKLQVTILPFMPPNYPFAITDANITKQVEEAFAVTKLWVRRDGMGIEYEYDMPVFITGKLQLLDPDDNSKVLAEMISNLPPGRGAGYWGASASKLPEDFLARVRGGELKTVRIRIVPDREQAIQGPTVEAYYGNVIKRTVEVDDDANRN